MGNTDGQWVQDTPSTDIEIFVGASEFKDSAGNAGNATLNGVGQWAFNIAAGKACTLVADIGAMFKRTGMYASAADLVYTVTGSALSTATIGLTDTVFANNVAPAVTNKIPLAANGLP